MTRQRVILASALLIAACTTLAPSPLWAADTTPPTTPVVTDDGTYTSDPTSLHAAWTSADPDTGIIEYQYLIRQDSTAGAILVNWTSTGATPSVTATGLSLLQGKWYYVQVKAKNGDGLWSLIGSSNGIRVDTTPPTAPPQPTEGGTTDADYDADGIYYVYWYASPLAADAESGISAYELQERVGVGGTWTTIVSTTAARYASLTGRLHNTQYFYQVRAKNGAGLWGAWSPVSDGILIDKTAPSTVTVTDDGAVAASPTQLHAAWTASSDPESGVAAYEYLIRQDSTAGTILVNYTSVGAATEVTKTGLTLLNGKLYYLGVRAKNAAGLYSATTYTDGIRAPDPTPPTAPGQPTEGSTSDLDFNGTGAYTIYWPAANDPDSGISAYELQERAGASGVWTTIATTSASVRSASVSGRLDKTQYFYQVRAKNGVGAWGDFSPVSDGMLVDKTAPTAVTVTDDGATTPSTTTLHAAWTASSDPESGVAAYEYLIRQDSTGGTILVNYTAIGLATEVTKSGLSLAYGKSYYLGVRAKNGAGLYSSIRYSNGITVSDTVPPTGTISINGAAASTNSPTVTLALSATDNSGTVSQMRFSNDNVTYAAPEPYAATKTWTVASGDGPKTVYVKFSDPAGNWSSPVSGTIVMDTTPPAGSISINSGAAATHTTTVTLTFSATDNAGTVAQMQCSNDNVTYFAPEPYVSGHTWTLPGGDGPKTVYVKFSDPAGNWSSPASATITLDTIPPTGTISINGAAASTNSPTVTLALSATDDSGTVAEMECSSDGLTYSTPEPYAATKAWTLSGGDGEKHVSVQFSDPAGNWSSPANATITLDTTPPSGTISINNGGVFTRATAVTLTLSATDNVGLVSQMRFSNDGVTYADPEPYTATKTWTLPGGDGTKTVSVQFSDPAGNWSNPVSGTIALDTTPPMITITFPHDGAVLGRQQ